MKKIIHFNKKIIICLFYFSLFFILSSKTYAGDVNAISHSGPTNNQITTSDVANFSFTFKVPELNDADINNQNKNKDSIYFEARVDDVLINLNETMIDGVRATTTGGGKYLIIFNGNKLDYENKTITKNWSIRSNTSVSSKIFKWKLYDYYTKKEYVNDSFTYKINSNYSGWYFIAKDETENYYYYKVSDRYTSEALCNTGISTFLEKESKYTISSKCANYDSLPATPVNEDKPVAVDGKINQVENKSIYKFLAPIGKITCMDTTGQDPNCISNNIGTYLNFIFKLGIGVCAALAVIMLIISGISYMGDESVFGKTEAKGKMFSAILGLLIAIGAWALLNTINPDLTGSKGLSIAQANIEVENESTPWVKYEKNDGKPVAGCPGGFTDVTSGNGNPIHVCKSIATDLAKLIAAAKKDGIILSGGGFRSKAEQMSLRAKNCQPPTRTQKELESGSISCRVATAIPGNSNHEKGLAIDFTCNGSSMGKTDTNNVCYKWLVANASQYGLYNKYATLKETWHWSVSGT